MKKRALSLFLALTLCLGLAVPALAAGETLPYDIPSTVEWSFPTLTGERISQDTYPGQAVVLIFFRANETCGNSNNTIEALSHAEWAKSDQFQIVAVGCGESGESEEVVKEHADTFYQDHGSADGNIQFCYATDREMWAVVPALQQLVGGEGYTYAMVYVFDGEGHLRDAWQGSYNAQNYKNALTLLGLLDPGAGGSTSYSGLYPVTISGSNDYDSAYQVLELLNSYRRENSLSELVMDQSLLNVGMRRAAETALFYDHTRPNGDYFFTAFPLQFTQGKSSENIAAGYGTPELVMSGWKDSPGHNANMLTPEHQSVGIGAFVDRNGTRYWVQVFSGQSGTEETSQSTGVKTVTTRTESLAENLDLAVSPNSATLYAGETETLSLYNRNIGWSGSQAPIYASYAASSDEDVATVALNEDGTVTLNALSQGSTTVQIGLKPKTEDQIPFTVNVPVTVRPSNYTVTVTNTQHGTVTASPTSAAAGTKVTITVAPDSGYELDTLTVKQTDGTAVEVNDNTFTMPASNVTVTPTFKELPPDTYTVTVATAQHGKVTASPTSSKAGTKITLTVTPDSGYELDTLTVKQTDGTAVEVTDNAFIMPAADVTVTPTFKELPPETYTVTVWSAQHGKVTASPKEGAAGTKVTLTITPDKGYELDTLVVKQMDGTVVPVTNNTFTLPAADVTVTPTFKELPPETYTVTVTNAQHGKVTASPASGTAGTKVTLTVTPDSGYELDTLIVKQTDGTAVKVTNNTFTMPASDVTVTPTFKELPPETYTVTVTAAQHGKVTATPTSGTAGTKVKLTVTPDNGYELGTLTVKQANGKTVAVAADNTFTLPASNVTVSATFKALPVDRLSLNRSSVSVSVGGSASVTATVSGYAGKHVYAISSDTSVATASVSGKTVRVKGVAQGAASVYVVMADTNAMTLDQAKADPSMKEIKVTVTKASSSGGSTGGGGSSGGGGGGGGGGSSGGSSGGSAGGSTPTTPTTPSNSATTSQTFTDVAKGSWYESGVTFVVSKGLFNGVGDGAFAPQQNMTRAMLMTVLARLDGQPTDGGAPWYSKGMDWAKAQGISDGTAPEGNITREQLVTMLYRYAQSPAVDAAMGMAGYADVDSISDWAQTAMRWAVQNGILTGKDGARLDPQGLATRAEVATILQRYVEKLGQ